MNLILSVPLQSSSVQMASALTQDGVAMATKTARRKRMRTDVVSSTQPGQGTPIYCGIKFQPSIVSPII